LERTVSVLYLAEVRKTKSGGLLAKTTTELKLLACQRTDQNWNAVPENEVVEGEVAAEYDSGVLVVVNLNNNRQVQGGVELAAAQIVRDLQRFSRQQEKFKAQEEEIEGWKQSLTLQAQEFKKRELELDEEFAQLEQQMQALEQQLAADGGGAPVPGAMSNEALAEAQAEADRIREEFERKSQDLDQAFAQLEGQKRQLAEREAALTSQEAQAAPPGNAIDPEHLGRLRELVEYLVNTHLPMLELNEQMRLLRESVEGQQANLAHYTQQLEEQRADAQQQQQTIDEQQRRLDEQQEQLQHTRMMIEEGRDRVAQLTQQLRIKEAEQVLTAQQLHQVSELQARLAALARGEIEATPPGEEEKGGVDVATLESMPEDELQQTIDQLQQEFERLGRFVADQEEELKLQREAVAEIEEKLKTATVYDAPALEQELADEQEQRKLLDETLVGQRRTLADKQAVLSVHLQVLRRRQGIATTTDDDRQIDLSPILETLAADVTTVQSQQDDLQSAIATLESELAIATADLQTHLGTCEQQQGEVQHLEAELKEGRSSAALLWGRVNLYEEMLAPQRETLEEMQQRLSALEELCQQTQQTGDYQQDALASLNEVVGTLAG
jgi:chromosome segregation ATPase